MAHPDQFAKQLDDLKARGKLDQGSYDLIQWYRVRAESTGSKANRSTPYLALAKTTPSRCSELVESKRGSSSDLQGLLSAGARGFFQGLAVTSDRSSAQAIARLIRPKQIVALLDEQLIAFDSEPKDYYKVVPVLPRTVDKGGARCLAASLQPCGKEGQASSQNHFADGRSKSLPGLSRYLSQVKELDAGERTRLELHLSLLAAMAYRAPSTTEKSQAPWVIAYRAWKACGDGKTSLELKRLTLATRAIEIVSVPPPGTLAKDLLCCKHAAIDAVTQRCNQGKPKSK